MQAAAPLVLGVFQEQHASAHPNMWEMVLAFVKAYPSAWHAVDTRKAVLPRLLAFLRYFVMTRLKCLHAHVKSASSRHSMARFCSKCKASFVSTPDTSHYADNSFHGDTVEKQSANRTLVCRAQKSAIEKAGS